MGVATAAEAITCPAGEPVETTQRGPACRCRVLHETLTRDENASSLQRFCAGDYQQCNVWRAMRDAELKRQERGLESEIAAAAGKEVGGRPVEIGAR